MYEFPQWHRLSRCLARYIFLKYRDQIRSFYWSAGRFMCLRSGA